MTGPAPAPERLAPPERLAVILTETRTAARSLLEVAPALPGVVGLRAERLAGGIGAEVQRWFPDV